MNLEAKGDEDILARAWGSIRYALPDSQADAVREALRAMGKASGQLQARLGILASRGQLSEEARQWEGCDNGVRYIKIDRGPGYRIYTFQRGTVWYLVDAGKKPKKNKRESACATALRLMQEHDRLMAERGKSQP